MVQELSALVGVPFEDMLVHNIQEANIKGRDCLTASLWITGENGAWGVNIYINQPYRNCLLFAV